MWDAGLPFGVIGPVRILETGTAQVGKGVGEMKAPWEYFEDLHESVYVADCDTYELLYMNRFAREQFEIETEDGYRGKKCYDVLQGLSQVCPFCTNESLRENEFYEWSYRNPVLKKTLFLKDTLIYWEGRRCRMEMAMNIECPNED